MHGACPDVCGWSGHSKRSLAPRDAPRAGSECGGGSGVYPLGKDAGFYGAFRSRCPMICGLGADGHLDHIIECRDSAPRPSGGFTRRGLDPSNSPAARDVKTPRFPSNQGYSQTARRLPFQSWEGTLFGSPKVVGFGDQNLPPPGKLQRRMLIIEGTQESFARSSLLPVNQVFHRFSVKDLDPLAIPWAHMLTD